MEIVLHPFIPLLSFPFLSPPLLLGLFLREEGKHDEGVFFKLRIFFYAHQARKRNAVAALIRQGVRCHEFRGFNCKDAASALPDTLNSGINICFFVEESRCGPC